MPVTRQVLFVQGGGQGVHDDWDAALVASLKSELGPGYEIRYPRMPHEGDPGYASWKVALDKEFAALDDGAILVGHSIGGTLLIHALAERPRKQVFGAIFLVAAPFMGEGGWKSDGWTPQEALGDKLPRDVPILLYHGLDDDTVPPSHAVLFADAIPQARLCRLPGRDHQLNNDLRELAAVIRSLGAAAVLRREGGA